MPLGEILRGKLGGVLPGLHYFIYGVIVIAVIRLSPGGVLPLVERLWPARRAQSLPQPAQPHS